MPPRGSPSSSSVGSVLIGGRDVLIPFALAALIWQLINAFAARCGKIPLVGRLGGNWLALTLGVVVIGLALSLVVDLIVLNVGAVSAAAPAYEANLLALLGRGAHLLGLPQPASLGPLAFVVPQAWPSPLIALDLPYPLPQRLRRAAELSGNRADRSPCEV